MNRTISGSKRIVICGVLRNGTQNLAERAGVLSLLAFK